MKSWHVPITLTVWATAVIEAESALQAHEMAVFGDFAERELLYGAEIQSWNVQPVSVVTEIK